MKQYHELLKTILENGTNKEDRTGTGTISIFGYQMRFDLQKGFPLLTTKKMATKAIISELLWFLEGSTDERRLAEIHYGDTRTNLKGKKTIWTANADEQGKKLGYINNEFVKRLGPVYGKQWRKIKDKDNENIDQIQEIITTIKKNPDSRRIILNAWNVSEIKEMALPPCHILAQFYVNDNKLSCLMYQRSADVFLGVPFNIASYALLTHMIAQVTGLQVGEFIHTIGDAHIYNNHIEQVNEQLQRDTETYDLCTLKLDPTITDIDKFTMESIEILNYKSYDTIKADMAV